MMTGPLDRPHWRAVEIGPGGVPPESVRPRGGDVPGPPFEQRRPAAPELPPAWQQWVTSAVAPEPLRRRGLHWPARKIAAAVAAVCILVGLALWSNTARPLGGTRGGQVSVGDCLSSSGRQIAGAVSCRDPAADFRVVGRYPGTDDANECSASPADLAVVQLGPTLLCLNFVAAAGDCLLLARQAGQLGRVECGSATTGEYRVRAVLANSIDPDGCPSGTTRTLVHRYNSEVLCLSRN